MRDLTNYYVLQNTKSAQYVGAIYQNSVSEQNSVDDALKLPEKETAFSLKKYLEWRSENDYRVMNFKTTFEAVEEE